MNDPLGAMKSGISSANESIKKNVKMAADGIKNNENLKQSLANAKEKSINGFNAASTYAGSAASKMKENAQHMYQQNYHGQMYESMQQKAQNFRKGSMHENGNEQELNSGFKGAHN